MTAERLLLGLLTSGVSTLGFCMVLKLSPRRFPTAVIGGMLTNLLYDLIAQSFGNLLLAASCAALFMALYSELGARIMRTPAISLLIPCLIPIVPGSYLYYTIYHLFNRRIDAFVQYGKGALQIGLGIAVGMSFASVLLNVSLYLLKQIKSKLIP